MGQSVRGTASDCAARRQGRSRGVRWRAEVKGQLQGKKRDDDESGQRQAVAWSALAQVPAVTEPGDVVEAWRTKRATLSVLVRMSPSTVALALLGKPNQGERLR